MIQRVLVPLDGSVLAESALHHAAVVARAFHARLMLLRVLESGRRGGQGVDSAEWRLRRSEALAYFERLLAQLHDQGLEAEAEIAEGRSPAEEIVGRARRPETDLLVISAHGRGGPSEFGFGGTAAKIVANAGSSLLVARGPAPAPADPAAAARYERIVVAVDTSQLCDWALSLAATLARGCGAELVLVHVVPPAPLPQRKPAGPRETRLVDKLVEVNRTAGREYLDEVRTKLGGSELRVRCELLAAAHVAHAIEELAETEHADLVVVSAHGASGSAPWPYGSVASALLSYGRTPILVFQDAPHGQPREGEPLLDSAAQAGNGWSR